MITERIIQFLSGISIAGFDLIPTAFGVPNFMESGFDALFSIFSAASSLTVWIPIPFVIAGIGFRLAVIVFGGAAKLARMVVSVMTGGGGSAA